MTVTVFGNHVTADDPVISGSTQEFPYEFQEFTGYRVSIVYSMLHKGMAYTKLYVNGRAITSKFFATGAPGRLGTTNIGALQEHSHAFFQGFIDDLRLWNIARPAWQIRSDYNKKLVGVEQGLIAYFPVDTAERKIESLGVSSWKMQIEGAVFSDPFSIGRRGDGVH